MAWTTIYNLLRRNCKNMQTTKAQKIQRRKMRLKKVAKARTIRSEAAKAKERAMLNQQITSQMPTATLSTRVMRKLRKIQKYLNLQKKKGNRTIGNLPTN